MKATGIVRRIDDLGRVVIPKEIRRTMRIREGDPLEIYTDREGEVIFKKYSPIGELSTFSSQYADTLHRTCSLNVVITDRDGVIAQAGVARKEYADRRLSKELEKLMEGRSLFSSDMARERMFVSDDRDTYYVHYAMPIISAGDVIGCVASLLPVEGNQSHPLGETEGKLIQTAANFLGKQMED